MIIDPQMIDTAEVLHEILTKRLQQPVEMELSLAGLRKETRFACVVAGIVVAVENESIVLYTTISDGRDSGYTWEMIQGPCTDTDLVILIDMMRRSHHEADGIYWPKKQSETTNYLVQAVKHYIQLNNLPVVLTPEKVCFPTGESLGLLNFTVTQQTHSTVLAHSQPLTLPSELVVFPGLSSYSYIRALRHIPLLFHWGVSQIWILDIRTRCMVVHHSPQESELIYPNQSITIRNGVLNGFLLPFNNVLLVETTTW